MSVLQIDFETRATVDLRTAGLYPYAEHPDTDIWCMAWAFDDDEPMIYDPRGHVEPEVRMPHPWVPSILEHIYHKGEIRAWNSQFERIIWREIMVKRYGWPKIRDEQFVCTAAEAAAMALPRSLDQCANVLKVGQKKDTEGYGLMMRMTRPRKIVDGRPVWWEDAAKFQRLCDYCKQDVRTERAIGKALRRLTPKEREVYLLDQRMNDYGVAIDRALILAAKEIAEEGQERANAALGELTEGAVVTVTNHKKLTEWLNAEGVETAGVSKPAVQELLESDLDPKHRAVLQLRADAGRTSVAKLEGMLKWACADDILRGMLLYHAASTGRWGGKGPQPHNYPRGEVADVESYIPLVMQGAGAYDVIDLFHHPIIVVSSLLRAMLVARPGHDLLAGDFSAIEARVLNWLAGQEDVLETFREYDAGDKARDPYKIMAVRMGRAERVADVTKQDRQAGKAAELGCGFQMGAKKFIDAAWKVYQVRVDRKQSGAAVKAYRRAHDKVVTFWHETEAACLAAIATPGVPVVFGGRQNLKVIVAGAYLYLILPSGRPLCYAAPRAVERTTTVEVLDETLDEFVEKTFTKVGMEYSGVDPYSKQWGTLRAYGGFLVENIVQAVARDLIAEALLRLEARGYPPILSVHDEAVCEVPQGEKDLNEFVAILAETPAWAAGCPVAAEGWRGTRYRK